MLPESFEIFEMSLEVVEYIVRYGVKDWRQLEYENESGEITSCAPTFENGPNGRRLELEAYNNLSFFYSQPICQELAARIYILSRS